MDIVDRFKKFLLAHGMSNNMANAVVGIIRKKGMDAESANASPFYAAASQYMYEFARQQNEDVDKLKAAILGFEVPVQDDTASTQQQPINIVDAYASYLDTVGVRKKRKRKVLKAVNRYINGEATDKDEAKIQEFKDFQLVKNTAQNQYNETGFREYMNKIGLKQNTINAYVRFIRQLMNNERINPAHKPALRIFRMYVNNEQVDSAKPISQDTLAKLDGFTEYMKQLGYSQSTISAYKSAILSYERAGRVLPQLKRAKYMFDSYIKSQTKRAVTDCHVKRDQFYENLLAKRAEIEQEIKRLQDSITAIDKVIALLNLNANAS
jgi:hypothetical protein